MTRKTCVLLFAVFTSIHQLFAQQLPSTLLWKISGNGLQKPSYLYGTMHLTDERIFNLGDSLYKAIEQTEGFATEIDPAELTTILVNETKKSALESVRLKDIIPPEKFKKYGKLLAEKLHKNEDDITKEDILHEKNKWIEESYSKGKMQTFLDIYLFDIARRQGKWTGGVEDPQDQEGLIDMIDESDIIELAINRDDEDTKKIKDANSESFINTYINNDLNAIDSISTLGDSVYMDALLIKRNRKMAMRMDSLSHVRSMVFAVGAAHLPGNKGVIALLKEKGFSVTPVFSSKKIKPTDYKVAEVPLKWYDITDEDSLYTASMPGKPGNALLYGIMNMQMYFDVFSSTVYMTSAIKAPYTQKMADSLFSEMVSNYFGVSDYKKGKPITINNVQGREFLSTKENYSHGYLLFKDGFMYMAIAMCMKKDNVAGAAINHFLHSYTILTPHLANGPKEFTYINNSKAYSVQTPSPPQSANELGASIKDSTLIRDLRVVNDPVSGAYLFFGTNESAPGFFIENDSTTLAQIEISQKERFAKLDVDTVYFKNGDRVMDLEGKMANAPLMMKARYRFRGNRWYALAAVYDTAKDHSSVDHFFNSFSTLDYAPAEWKNYASADTVFYTWAPMNFSEVRKMSESADRYSYNSYDSTRGDSYSIIVENFSKYYWQKNDSSFWNALTMQYEFYDSILLKKEITNGGSNGYELEIQQKGSANIKRVRLLLNAGKLYTIMTVQAATEINNANNNKFFDSLRFNHTQPSLELFNSKASLLLNDIGSQDSAIAAEAVDHLRSASFSKEDLPLLHHALLKKYAQDNGSYFDTRNILKRIIINLKDSSSFTFAKENYALVDDTSRNQLLDIMASFPTKENYIGIRNILIHQTPRIEPEYDFSNSLTDSLQLTAGILPDLLPLFNDTVTTRLMVRISRKLMDSSFISKDLLIPYEHAIIQLAQKDYDSLCANPNDYKYTDYNLLYVVGKLNTLPANAMLQKWSVSPLAYFQLNAVSYLLQNKQSINPLAIRALAKDKNTRINLYDSLKAYQKQNLFPSEYSTQRSFGESLAYTASDDYDPSAITYLMQQTINFKGRQSRFYFYKIVYGDSDDTQSFLGCAGPFPLKSTDISLKDATGAIYEDTDFDTTDQKVQMNALIKQMEEGFEWTDKKTGKKK